MAIYEDQLAIWAKAPSESEEIKCQSAVDRITKAVREKFGYQVSVFLQGSYKNRTNIKLDSDVDIVVRHNGYYFPEISGLSEQDKAIYKASFRSADYTFTQFKADLCQILGSKFGSDVIRKNKCIRVNGNSYRVSADVIPCYVHKRFRTSDMVSAEGIEFVSDQGDHIYSFPEQHYGNGVKKNEDTNQMFKPIVRIMKHIRNELVDDGIIVIEQIPSFFLECLVWNVLPHTHFHKSTYRDASKAIASAIWSDMRDASKAERYAEVSDLKWLFKGQAKRTPQQAFEFINKVWDFIG